MLGILFILVCAVFGYELVSFLVPDIRRLYVATAVSKKQLTNIPDLLFKVPAGIITGISIATFLTYYASLGFSYVLTRKQTAITAGTAVVTVIMCYMIFMFIDKERKKKKEANPKIPNFDNSIKNTLFYGISIVLFTTVASFLFFYTFRISDGMLINGYSVFSDLSPHTAMTSSFSVGSNFPTQYMHYSGDGIQYHFFFYFFCGILGFLGFPIDYAINVPSIIAMVCCFMLLGLLGVLLSGRRMTFFFAPLLVLFRSSFNVFSSFSNMMQHEYGVTRSINVLLHSFSWFKQTPYDDWGIWAINVYANQRHLMFGVSMILILVILFVPYVRRLCISVSSDGFKSFFLTKNSWIPRKGDPLSPYKNLILACILVIVMPYIHGSALIAGLLILFGMAIVSESRLSYLAVAVCAVASSYIQTRIFSGSYTNMVKFSLQSGFVSNESTFGSPYRYLIYITGFTLISAVLFAVARLVFDILKKRPPYMPLLFVTFLLPLIFAFNVKVSLEMLANHKFIQISLIFVDIFVASLLANLFWLPFAPKKDTGLPKLLPLDNDKLEEALNKESEDKKKFILPLPAFIPTQVLSVIIALCLLVGLTGTGIVEWCVYININKGHIDVNTRSELVDWIEHNTSSSDVFLTPMWSVNRFFLAGRPAYYGWPYFAWSAGHDTYTRDEIYQWLITGCNGDIDKFVSYCKEREIKYLVFDPEFYDIQNAEGKPMYNAEFFASNLKQVAYFPEDNHTIVYQIY
ncbi:MAG: hypothetical protein J6U23_00945 [Clostridiales bacterium]|nr:hypothetical protein [Clostridiales bacterium]